MYKLEIIDSTEFDGLDTRNSYFYKNDIDSLYSPNLPDTKESIILLLLNI